MEYKTFFFASIAIVCIGVVGLTFWNQEIKYLTPTPKPKNLKSIQYGDSVDLTAFGIENNRRAFLHFYNEDCPCSRFNRSEFENLVIKYHNDIDFYIVNQGTDESEINTKSVTTIVDKNGKLADVLGIYSTPQAVLIDNSRIFFKGNYNKARFCTATKTKYASIAIEALLNGTPLPDFPQLAFIAYGCELPSHSSNQPSFFDF